MPAPKSSSSGGSKASGVSEASEASKATRPTKPTRPSKATKPTKPTEASKATKAIKATKATKASKASTPPKASKATKASKASTPPKASKATKATTPSKASKASKAPRATKPNRPSAEWAPDNAAPAGARATAAPDAARADAPSGAAGGVASVVEQLTNRIIKPLDEMRGDIEQLVGRGREQLGSAGRRARRTDPIDRLVRGADRARRTVGVGPSFPILGYDDLTARQVQDRLNELTVPELRKVRDHERRHANRKSVLAAIERSLT